MVTLPPGGNQGHRHRALVTQIEPPARVISCSLPGMMLAAVIVPLNSTMIAIALPDISDDLSVGKGTAGNLVMIYLVVMLVGQPLGGRIGDRIGSCAAVVLGLSGVAVTSVLAPAVKVFVALVVIRGIQAVFAALLVRPVHPHPGGARHARRAGREPRGNRRDRHRVDDRDGGDGPELRSARAVSRRTRRRCGEHRPTPWMSWPR